MDPEENTMNYVASLVMTIVIELCVAFALGFRSESAWKTVIIVNLMTHPVFAYVVWINNHEKFISDPVLIPVLEMIVVLIEWGLFYFVLRENPRHLFRLSFAINLASYGFGLILLGL
jgi:hypothetical protein